MIRDTSGAFPGTICHCETLVTKESSYVNRPLSKMEIMSVFIASIDHCDLVLAPSPQNWPRTAWTNTEAINNSYLLAVPADVEVGNDRGAGNGEHLVVGVAGHPTRSHQQCSRQEAEGGVNDCALDHLAALDEVAEEDGDADNGQQAQSATANNISINIEHETMYAPDHTESMNK